MTKLENFKRSTALFESLVQYLAKLNVAALKELTELQLTDFAYHMATAINSVDDACDELKKISEQMEASNGDSE